MAWVCAPRIGADQSPRGEQRSERVRDLPKVTQGQGERRPGLLPDSRAPPPSLPPAAGRASVSSRAQQNGTHLPRGLRRVGGAPAGVLSTARPVCVGAAEWGARTLRRSVAWVLRPWLFFAEPLPASQPRLRPQDRVRTIPGPETSLFGGQVWGPGDRGSPSWEPSRSHRPFRPFRPQWRSCRQRVWRRPAAPRSAPPRQGLCVWTTLEWRPLGGDERWRPRTAPSKWALAHA